MIQNDESWYNRTTAIIMSYLLGENKGVVFYKKIDCVYDVSHILYNVLKYKYSFDGDCVYRRSGKVSEKLSYNEFVYLLRSVYIKDIEIGLFDIRNNPQDESEEKMKSMERKIHKLKSRFPLLKNQNPVISVTSENDLQNRIDILTEKMQEIQVNIKLRKLEPSIVSYLRILKDDNNWINIKNNMYIIQKYQKN